MTPPDLARLMFARYAKQYNPDKTFDTLAPEGQRPWLKEATEWLAEIKKHRAEQ